MLTRLRRENMAHDANLCSHPPAATGTLAAVMENPVDNSGMNPRARQSRRLWWGIGVGGLVLVFVAGLLTTSHMYRRMQVLEEVERLGGYYVPWNVRPKWLRTVVDQQLIAAYAGVGGVELIDTQMTDDRLEHLKELPELGWL